MTMKELSAMRQAHVRVPAGGVGLAESAGAVA